MSGSFLFSYSISVTAIPATAFDHNRAQVSKLFYQIKLCLADTTKCLYFICKQKRKDKHPQLKLTAFCRPIQICIIRDREGMFRSFCVYIFIWQSLNFIDILALVEFGVLKTEAVTFKHDIRGIIHHCKHAKFNWIRRIHQNKHLKRNSH